MLCVCRNDTRRGKEHCIFFLISAVADGRRKGSRKKPPAERQEAKKRSNERQYQKRKKQIQDRKDRKGVARGTGDVRTFLSRPTATGGV